MHFAAYSDLARASMAYWTMLGQAQTVIAYRMMGLSGVLVAAPDETARMVSEKAPAFAAANIAAAKAIFGGASATRIAEAWLTPIGAETSANARRLSRPRRMTRR